MDALSSLVLFQWIASFQQWFMLSNSNQFSADVFGEWWILTNSASAQHADINLLALKFMTRNGNKRKRWTCSEFSAANWENLVREAFRAVTSQKHTSSGQKPWLDHSLFPCLSCAFWWRKVRRHYDDMFAYFTNYLSAVLFCGCTLGVVRFCPISICNFHHKQDIQTNNLKTVFQFLGVYISF